MTTPKIESLLTDRSEVAASLRATLRELEQELIEHFQVTAEAIPLLLQKDFIPETPLIQEWLSVKTSLATMEDSDVIGS